MTVSAPDRKLFKAGVGDLATLDYAYFIASPSIAEHGGPRLDLKARPFGPSGPWSATQEGWTANFGAPGHVLTRRQRAHSEQDHHRFKRSHALARATGKVRLALLGSAVCLHSLR